MIRRFASVALAVWVWFAGAADARSQQVLIKPYVQPGNGSTLGEKDTKVLVWFTDPTPGEFRVEFGPAGGSKRVAEPTRITLDFPPPAVKVEAPKSDAASDKKAKDEKAAKEDKSEKKEKGEKEEEAASRAKREAEARARYEKAVKEAAALEQHYFKYTAVLDDLPFGSEIEYRVTLGAEVVREASFRTRAPRDKAIRFALVGDMANGKSGQNAVAYELAKENPEFLLALGDIVYPTGTVSQYRKYFWGTYNDVEKPSAKSGAPLMATITVYPVLGNHDVSAKLADTPDALGAYYFFHPPHNGPGRGKWNTPLDADKATLERFAAATRESYPSMDAYSFDYGPLHVVVINSNRAKYLDEPKFREWVERDLAETDARWKLVCYHAPAFQSSKEHYGEQTLRAWTPTWKKHGVDLVFAGHVHNYQRGAPLDFVDPQPGKGQLVNGTFVLDREFDGREKTTPKGIIHIVAGGGGATLYSVTEENIAKLKKDYGDNYSDFTTRSVHDRHTFVVIDMTPEKLTLRAIDGAGEEVDRVTITK